MKLWPTLPIPLKWKRQSRNCWREKNVRGRETEAGAGRMSSFLIYGAGEEERLGQEERPQQRYQGGIKQRGFWETCDLVGLKRTPAWGQGSYKRRRRSHGIKSLECPGEKRGPALCSVDNRGPTRVLKQGHEKICDLDI